MEKHGLSLADLEAVNPASDCEQFEIEINEMRRRPVIDVAYAITDFTDTQSWYVGSQGGYRLVFFGLPEDVRIAVHLAKLIRDAMDLEWRFWWAVNCGLTSAGKSAARKNFMAGMVGRISLRLYSMKQKREA